MTVARRIRTLGQIIVNNTPKLEKLGLLFGVLISAGSLAYGSLAISAAVFLGALFGSVNLRLLIWSWGAAFQHQAASEPQEASDAGSAIGVLPRFVLKYTVLIAGMALLLMGARVNPIGFGVGVSNVFLAILVYALLPHKTE